MGNNYRPYIAYYRRLEIKRLKKEMYRLLDEQKTPLDIYQSNI